MDSEIVPIFSIGIYKNIIRAPTNKELNCINSYKLSFQNSGNTMSEDRYVLNNPDLKDLANVFLENIKQYADDIMGIDNEMYITTSWINSTNSNQQHNIHNHPISILSGSYYIDVEDSQPSISFNRMSPPFLFNMFPNKFNAFNSTQWTIPVRNNMLVIFPSSCYHYVNLNTNLKPRVSIAFDTFIKGSIGRNFSGVDLNLN